MKNVRLRITSYVLVIFTASASELSSYFSRKIPIQASNCDLSPKTWPFFFYPPSFSTYDYIYTSASGALKRSLAVGSFLFYLILSSGLEHFAFLSSVVALSLCVS